MNSNTNQSAFPFEAWKLSENTFNSDSLGTNASIFSLANGAIGFRGDFEEGLSDNAYTNVEGTFLNGFFESEPIRYGEIAYGYAQNSQTILNVANAKRIRLLLDEEEFNLSSGTCLSYKRCLKFQDGILEREIFWQSPKGHKVRIVITRFVSQANPNLAGIRYRIIPVDYKGMIRLVSGIDSNAKNRTVESDPRVGSGLRSDALKTTDVFSKQNLGRIVQYTQNSGLALACAVKNCIIGTKPDQDQWKHEKQCLSYCCEWKTAPDEIVLEKWISYYFDTKDQAPSLIESATSTVQQAAKNGWEYALSTHQASLSRFWEKADIQIGGNARLQQGLRFNLFQMFQSAGRSGRSNIAAKGLTGEGYEGHYFWDSETYIFPFFLHTVPETAKSLLLYRYSILDKARERARQMGHHSGALFPWRTINGEECSAYYPAGTAQYHINADIAFSVNNYVTETDDVEFMRTYGLEILVETARLWLDLGFFNEQRGGCFCINGVTGPDEYNALVNNNCYTNLMAQKNLSSAAFWSFKIRTEFPKDYAALTEKIGVNPTEEKDWWHAAELMEIPFDDKCGIHLQDDAFLDRVPWPLKSIPKETFPLLLHYHPLVIYRHQVCKQADLVLAMLMLSSKFSSEEKKRNYDFYEPLTTHDSSLSRAVFGILASELHYTDKAESYFEDTALFDLDNRHSNVKDGLHMANMGGAWMSIVYGFAGMRYDDNLLHFSPVLPSGWEYYEFCIQFKGRSVRIHIDSKGATFCLIQGEPLTVYNGDKEIFLQCEDVIK
jgi:trehalose/maltose hydrolase-like predicted phosphorylase